MSERYFLVADMIRTVPAGREPRDVIGEDFASAIELNKMQGEYDTIGERGAVALDRAKIDPALQRQIDEAAGAFRQHFITDVPGQELTYLRKEAEARDQTSGGAGPWPMLEAEAAATNKTLAELAAEVVARADAWVALGAKIEAARQGAKQAVAASETEDGKRSAAAVDWAALLEPGAKVAPLGGRGPN